MRKIAIVMNQNFISKKILTLLMRIKTVKVSDKGQISLPVDIRKATGIKKGDELLLIQDGKKILIESAPNFGKKVTDDFSDLMKISEKSLLKLWDNEADKVWDDFKK